MAKNISLLITFFLIYFSTQAQYKGGKGDGFAMAETKNVTLGITEKNVINKINIYPNPVSVPGYLTLEIEGRNQQKYDVEIVDIVGRKIDEFILVENYTFQLDRKHFPAGIYMVKIVSGDGEIRQHKLLVQ